MNFLPKMLLSRRYPFVGQSGFDEGAADLLVAHIDVVGPFDGGRQAFGLQVFDQAEGDDLRQEELVGSRQEGGFEQDRKHQVFPGAALPAVALLPAAGGLEAGCVDGAVGKVVVEADKAGVGRVDRVKPVDVFCHNFSFFPMAGYLKECCIFVS